MPQRREMSCVMTENDLDQLHAELRKFLGYPDWTDDDLEDFFHMKKVDLYRAAEAAKDEEILKPC